MAHPQKATQAYQDYLDSLRAQTVSDATAGFQPEVLPEGLRPPSAGPPSFAAQMPPLPQPAAAPPPMAPRLAPVGDIPQEPLQPALSGPVEAYPEADGGGVDPRRVSLGIAAGLGGAADAFAHLGNRSSRGGTGRMALQQLGQINAREEREGVRQQQTAREDQMQATKALQALEASRKEQGRYETSQGRLDRGEGIDAEAVGRKTALDDPTSEISLRDAANAKALLESMGMDDVAGQVTGRSTNQVKALMNTLGKSWASPDPRVSGGGRRGAPTTPGGGLARAGEGVDYEVAQGAAVTALGSFPIPMQSDPDLLKRAAAITRAPPKKQDGMRRELEALGRKKSQDLKDYGTNLSKSNIPVYESSLDEIDKMMAAAKKEHGGEIFTGMDEVWRRGPAFSAGLMSDSTQDIIARVQKLQNMEIKDTSGAAVTITEMPRIQKAQEGGVFSNERDLVRYLKTIRDELQVQKEHYGRVAGVDIVEAYDNSSRAVREYYAAESEWEDK